MVAACIGAAWLVEPPPARAQARAPTAVAEAAKGRAAYERGDFRGAIELYESAYALEKSPTLLFNLGRCYEALATEGDLRVAIEKYEAYLAASRAAPDREAVKRRIEALREQVRVLESARTSSVTPPASSPPPAPTRGEVTEPSSSPSPWPWVLAGSGGAVLTAGVALGVIAVGTRDDAIASPSGREAMDLESASGTQAAASTILVVAGAAMAIGGVTWGTVDVVRSGDRSARRVRLQVGASKIALSSDF